MPKSAFGVDLAPAIKIGLLVCQIAEKLEINPKIDAYDLFL